MKSKKFLLPIFCGALVFLLAGCGNKEQDRERMEQMNREGNGGRGNGQGNMNMQPADETPEKAVEYKDISVEEGKKMIDEKKDLVVIDVSPNYAKGHLPRAVNYYVGDGSLDKAIPTLDKNKEYLVYCHVDSASQLGAQKLVDAGFKKVYRLAGNYSAWVKAGYPIEK